MGEAAIRTRRRWPNQLVSLEVAWQRRQSEGMGQRRGEQPAVPALGARGVGIQAQRVGSPTGSAVRWGEAALARGCVDSTRGGHAAPKAEQEPAVLAEPDPFS